MLMRLFRKPVAGSPVPVPPRKLVDSVGGGDYTAIGQEFFTYFTELSRLQPDEHVLDVGCGCGRMAAPLASYLSDRARYEGFDIQPAGVQWCRRNITLRRPNFRFAVADVFNQAYNPAGKSAPGEYRFPYEDESFDFVILTSVFTHMLRADMQHYLGEIVRVTKPGGRCLITYFLLTDESRGLIARGHSTLAFPDVAAQTAVLQASKPEAAVAFPVEDVRELFRSLGLTIEEPIRFGSWCGRDASLSYQDIVLARR